MSEFVSIADLQEPEQLELKRMVGSPIQWELPLPPHIDTEKLQINLSRLNALHQVGAFAASLVTEYHGESSETTGIAGINADGSAIAGKSKTNIVEPTKTNLIPVVPFDKRTEVTFGKPILQHEINRNEAVDQVIEMKSKGVEDTVAWGKVIDRAMRHSFRVAGKNHLTGRQSRLSNSIDILFYTAVVKDSIEAFAGDGTPDYILIAMGFKSLFLGVDTLKNKYMFGDPMMNHYRWSIFDRSQFDRYIALNGLTKFPGLVKTRA